MHTNEILLYTLQVYIQCVVLFVHNVWLCVNLLSSCSFTIHHVAYMTAQNCNDYNLICSMYYLRIFVPLSLFFKCMRFVHSFHFALTHFLFCTLCVRILIFAFLILHSSEEFDIYKAHTHTHKETLKKKKHTNKMLKYYFCN